MAHPFLEITTVEGRKVPTDHFVTLGEFGFSATLFRAGDFNDMYGKISRSGITSLVGAIAKRDKPGPLQYLLFAHFPWADHCILNVYDSADAANAALVNIRVATGHVVAGQPWDRREWHFHAFDTEPDHERRPLTILADASIEFDHEGCERVTAQRAWADGGRPETVIHAFTAITTFRGKIVPTDRRLTLREFHECATIFFLREHRQRAISNVYRSLIGAVARDIPGGPLRYLLFFQPPLANFLVLNVYDYVDAVATAVKHIRVVGSATPAARLRHGDWALARLDKGPADRVRPVQVGIEGVLLFNRAGCEMVNCHWGWQAEEPIDVAGFSACELSGS